MDPAVAREEGAQLRARREALGLSLKQVQDETRIPVPWLRALEEGQVESLPEGPFRRGYLRTYKERLGLPPTDEPPEPAAPAPPPSTPLWLVRLVAMSLAMAVVGSIVLFTWRDGLPMPDEDTRVALGAPTQQVTVRMLRDGPLRIVVDGQEVLDRRVVAGEEHEVAGRDRIEIHVPAAEAVRVRHNGTNVLPQGRQDEPRRLVFIDDGP